MSENKKRRGMIIGALVGAILGAGAAYLLMTDPAEQETGEGPNPLTAKDVLGLTSTAAALLRKLDDFRRRT